MGRYHATIVEYLCVHAYSTLYIPSYAYANKIASSWLIVETGGTLNHRTLHRPQRVAKLKTHLPHDSLQTVTTSCLFVLDGGLGAGQQACSTHHKSCYRGKQQNDDWNVIMFFHYATFLEDEMGQFACSLPKRNMLRPGHLTQLYKQIPSISSISTKLYSHLFIQWAALRVRVDIHFPCGAAEAVIKFTHQAPNLGTGISTRAFKNGSLYVFFFCVCVSMTSMYTAYMYM